MTSEVRITKVSRFILLKVVKSETPMIRKFKDFIFRNSILDK